MNDEEVSAHILDDLKTALGAREHFDQRLDELYQELTLITEKLKLIFKAMPKCCCEPLMATIMRNQGSPHGSDATWTWLCPIHGRQYG